MTPLSFAATHRPPTQGRDHHLGVIARHDTSRYLTFLAERGYPLAEVEHRACGRTVLPENPDETPDAESTR